MDASLLQFLLPVFLFMTQKKELPIVFRVIFLYGLDDVSVSS